MSETITCSECGESYSEEEFNFCPNCSEEELITCEECRTEYSSEDDECPHCAEWKVPEGTECEFCDRPATNYVQDHPVCDDHFDDAYPID